MVSAAVTRLQPGVPLQAAGYVRVSRKVQAEGHSPDIQREAIKRLARQEGYILPGDMIEEDHERGSKVTREGYQRIIQGVREGRVHVVLVYMFDRWGRDGIEWLARARELDRLGVPIISVVEGRDQGGLMRFVRAGMAQWFSEQLAQKTRPAREAAAREGTHCGSTPFGYTRVYPAWDGKGRRPSGVLVPCEPEAGVVRELFRRYAAGGWSGRTLAAWLNADPTAPQPPSSKRPEAGAAPRAERWSADTILDMLRSEVYAGDIRYNVQCRGLYEMAPPGSEFTVPGKHTALVGRDVWDAVQVRLTAARSRPTANGAHHAPTLAGGLLVCAGCGGHMTTVARHLDPTRAGNYVCRARRTAQSACREGGYRIDVAHEALLAAVRRLRGAPWTPQAEARLLGPDDTLVRRQTALAQDLAQLKDKQLRHARRFAEALDDPTPEEIAVFRQLGAEYSARIALLEQDLSALGAQALHLPALRALHRKLARTEVAGVVDTLSAQGDQVALRELLAELVVSAHVVARWPEPRSTWLRLEVTWHPDIQTLLDAGLLTLDMPAAQPQAPPVPRAILLRRARNKRYYDKQKAGRQDLVATTPPGSGAAAR